MDRESLEKRPAIVVVGSPNVGKRTLLSRLLNVDFEDASDTLPELSVHGWTINTKYYTADVAVWAAHLSEELSAASFPCLDRVVALVMVFDTSDLSSLVVLKEWVSRTDIQKFDILLCIGNKVDLLPVHPAHVEYKRRLLKLGDSSVNAHLDFSEYGISETEGSSLLGDEEPSLEYKRLCQDWCLEHNIEYVEACASNADFDQCLSVDGDSQGVERLYGALSAHMWPGMLLKSGDKINEPSLPEQEELSSEEESDYEPEYEILSAGSADPWDDVGWKSADGPISTSEIGGQMEKNLDTAGRESEVKTTREENRPSTSASQLPEELDREEATMAYEADPTLELDEDTAYDFEDLEVLMAEIGNMRNGLRLMPDFQRREMAAKLAMKMATMFGDSSGGEEELID
ncbi:GTP binding protein [Perilla frutescens var. hirtella]|nr:GTP binding protein [Perilla frutescens var. frutescens]KAH6793824.1 GTP binding protein [Perilla frutescens var. hirtella]